MSTGVELATAWVRLVPSMDGVQGEVAKSLGGVDSEFDKGGKSAGTKFSKAAGVAALAGAALVAGGLVKIFNTGLEEMKFGEKLNAQTDQLVANTGFPLATSQINDYTLALSKVSGISEEDLQSAGNNIIKFGGVSEDVYKRAVDSINDMGAAGKDVEGTSLALGKALADPAKAAGLLKKQGVILNEEQLKLIKNFTDTGDKAGAQGVILDALKGTYDGMAEKTGGTLQGNLDKLQNAFENVSGDLVSALIPAITGTVNALSTFALWAEDNQTPFMILLGLIGFLAVAIAVLTVVQWAMNTALLANPITWIILGIVALIAIIIVLMLNWDTVVKFLTDVWAGFISWCTDVINGFVSWWNGVWTGFAAWIGSVWSGFIGFITGVWAGFIGWLTGIVLGLLAWWNGVWQGFSNLVRTVWATMVGAINGIWSGFIGWVMGVVNGFVSWWNGIWSGIGAVINSVWSNIGSFISGIWNGIISTIRGSVNNIIGIINGMIGSLNGLLSGIGALTGMHLSLPKIPGLATGGTITRTGTVLVGENGPELLNLPRGASVNPDIPGTTTRGDVIFKNYAPLGQSPAQALTEFANRAGGIFP